MNEHLSRLQTMAADGQQTWDLSPNDVAAIRGVLSLVDRLTKLCEIAGVPKGAHLIDFNPTLTPEIIAHGKSLEEVARKALEDSQ